MKKALVTLAVGDRYINDWKQFSEPSWRRYAQRHGYELIVFTESLDTSPRAQSRSVAWQKCLILNQPETADFERVVWVDADIVINDAAPDIDVPLDHIGAVDMWATPSIEFAQLFVDRARARYTSPNPATQFRSAAEYYTTYGLPTGHSQVVQTGVLALSVEHHNDLLLAVYENYEEVPGAENHYEMRPLSHEIIASDVGVTWLDWKFNSVLAAHEFAFYPYILDYDESRLGQITDRLIPALSRNREVVNAVFDNSWFLHFAGRAKKMKFLS